MKSPESDQHLAEIKRLLRGLDEAKIIVAKTHEFIPTLLNLCQQTVVLSIRRNLYLTSKSIMLSNWLKHDAFDELVALHKLAMRRRACWLSWANTTIEVDYESLVADPQKSMALIADTLDYDADAKLLQSVVAQGMEGEANVGFPATKQRSLDETQIRAIEYALTRPEVAAWQRAMGYNAVDLRNTSR
mmetsp:Transcript_13064/g.32261  ORF Transcript_13064/g.32261 Transcript_13064/m.32261 type:complete len:188 (+) Transcript_13064:138-701(+)